MQSLKIFKNIRSFSRYNISLFNHSKYLFGGVESSLKVLPENLETLPSPGKVLVLSLKTCPYCELAKEFLEEREVEFEYIVADKLGITQEQKNQLQKFTGAKTFPRIFIGQTSIGGFNDMIRLHDKGELKNIFSKENIEFNEE